MQLLGQLQVRREGVTPKCQQQQGAWMSRTFCITPSDCVLQVEVENFVLRVAAEFSSRKEQLVFLINNYDMMLGVLMVRALLPRLPHRAHGVMRAKRVSVMLNLVFGVHLLLSSLRSGLRMTAKRLRVSSSCSMLAHRWGHGTGRGQSCVLYSAYSMELGYRGCSIMDLRFTELALLYLPTCCHY